MALLLFGVAYALFYVLIWNVQRPEGLTQWTVLVVVAGGLVLIVVHELIHAAMAWSIIGRGAVGLRVRLMVVECYVSSCLTRNQYIRYAVAPTLVLGLIGIALYYVLPSVEGKFFASLLFLASVAGGGGDFWFIVRVLRYHRNCSILDRGTVLDIFESDPNEP